MITFTKNEHEYSASAVELTVEDALVLIGKLTAGILHAQKHNVSSFSQPTILVVEDSAEDNKNFSGVLNISIVKE